jgi:hypothetical protein
VKFDFKIFIIAAASLVVLNLFFLDFLFWQLKKETVVSPVAPEPEKIPTEVLYQEWCGDECEKKIAEEVSRQMATIAGEIETGKEEEIQEEEEEKVETPSQPRLAYMPLGSGGSTIETSWTGLSGSKFIFNLADYPSGTEFYWHVNLKVKDANSRCYARIYDSDNYRTVDFSELSTASTSFETLGSSRLVFWAGANHYQLQIKSLSGSPCYLESPKLIIKG